MNGLIMRIRMRHCLHVLEKQWYLNNDFITGEDALKFSDTMSKLKILKALEAVNCVSLSYADNSNRPYVIREGRESSIYLLTRREIWANRLWGFIAGILTAVASHYIIQLLQTISF